MLVTRTILCDIFVKVTRRNNMMIRTMCIITSIIAIYNFENKVLRSLLTSKQS